MCIPTLWTHLLISAMVALQLSTVLRTSKRLSSYSVQNTLSWPLGYTFLCLAKEVIFSICFPPHPKIGIEAFVYCCILFPHTLISLVIYYCYICWVRGGREYESIWLLCCVSCQKPLTLLFLYHPSMSNTRKTQKPTANNLKHCHRKGIWILCDFQCIDQWMEALREKIKFS